VIPQIIFLSDGRYSAMPLRIKWTFVLALLCLPAPFVYMPIGPEGYIYYGPHVPDIWILGAYILGKDTSFFGIGIAWKWQLGLILYTALSVLFYGMSRRLFWLFQNVLLLLLFPFWLYAYTGGVMNNSDGADLSVYPMPGLLLWLAVLLLHLKELYVRGIRRPVSNH